MKRIEGFNEVEAFGASTFDFPKPNGYVAVIKNARDVKDREYLELLIDIAEGEYAGFYQDYYEANQKWLLRSYCSYKETALKAFKGFTTSVDNSNAGFDWESHWDENKLKGKKVGIILREEEYLRDDGSVGNSLKIYGFRSADTIRKGNFKIPPKKELSVDEKRTTGVNKTFSKVNLDDIQF